MEAKQSRIRSELGRAQSKDREEGWKFAGGDDTVGWVLGCLGEFNKEGTSPITHVDIITLYQGVLVG
ncbi:hypothetical protein F2Q68_00025145 [Brassica cretica]|uniref:Uncharacterized protein n=1 Tax=Brassica cretica TaxID=69181 RepID=A0A8S9II74_BRACR|nr:hypothetical protein F2Q68_00025145 [Brassica cretica]